MIHQIIEINSCVAEVLFLHKVREVKINTLACFDVWKAKHTPSLRTLPQGINGMLDQIQLWF